MSLTVLVFGTPGNEAFDASFDVIDTANGHVVGAAAPTGFASVPWSRTTIATTLVAVFGRSGTFAMGCLVGGAEQFRASFEVHAAVPD